MEDEMTRKSMFLKEWEDESSKGSYIVNAELARKLDDVLLTQAVLIAFLSAILALLGFALTLKGAFWLIVPAFLGFVYAIRTLRWRDRFGRSLAILQDRSLKVTRGELSPDDL